MTKLLMNTSPYLVLRNIGDMFNLDKILAKKRNETWKIQSCYDIYRYEWSSHKLDKPHKLHKLSH